MKLRALAFSFVLVVSIIGGSVAFAGSVGAAQNGFVGVPNEQVYSDLPENTPMGQHAQEIADAGVMASDNADTLEVVVTSPGRAKNVIDGGEIHGSGPVSIVLTDDQNSEGRTVALPAAEIEAALGFQPEIARGTHEDGTPWNAEIEYDDGWMLVDVPHFSSNTVSFAGEVQIGDTFADGSSTQYDIQDLDSASDVTVNLTGVNSTEFNNLSGSGVSPPFNTPLSVAGNTEPTDGSAGDPSIEVTGQGVYYDLSSASYIQSTDVSGQDSENRGISFSPDGTKMFVAGDANNNIYEYSLSTAYDISTASYSQTYDVSTQDSSPHDVTLGDNGSKMYVAGNANDNIYEYSLSTAYDISTASHVQTFDVSSEDTSPFGIEVRKNGSWMYVLGYGNDKVYQYSLSTAYDISTATYSQSFDVSSEEASPRAFGVSGDGTTMHVAGSGSANIHEYDLSTAYNVSSASYSTSFDVSTQDSIPHDIVYSTDGTQMFMLGLDTNSVYEYSASSTPTDISVSDGDGHSHSFGSFSDGETKTTSLDIQTTATELNITGSGGGLDYKLTLQEHSVTENPGVELNGNESINHSGTLADGESVQYTISESALREGTNTINVSMPSLSADAPVMQTRVDYSHDAQDNQIVEYTGEKFTERYNVSKTYASDRTNPELVIDFADTAVAIRNAEYRVNGGDWQTTSDWTVENTTGTIQLPDVAAEDTIEVRVDATKVSVSNGEIQVTEPTPMGERLDTELVVTERSDGDFKLGLADSPDAKRIHYVYDQDNPDAYNHIEANGDHDLVAANAALNDVFRVSTIPVTVEPSTNDVRVSVGNPQSTEPIFNVEPGANSGDEVAFTYVDAQDDTDYVLYSQTRDVVVDSGTASSPLTLVNDDSEEALQFLIDDGESSATDGGDVTGVVGPIPDGSSVDFSGLQYVAYLIGAIILLLFVVYWFRGRDEAEEVASSASSGTASTVTGSLRWIASGIASTSNWLGSHPYIAGTLGVGAALGLFATGIFQIPQGAGVMLLVAGAPLVSWMVLRRWGDQSLVVWGGTTFVALIVGLQLLGTDLFAIVFDSQAGVIAMIGVIGLAYYALRTYQTEASTPDEQTNVSFNLESDGGRDEGGD